jgi:hypothetical protein
LNRSNRRLLGILSLICLIVTAAWLALLIYTTVTRGAVESYAEALGHASALDLLDVLTYVNAALITLTATMLFAGLYVVVRPQAPLWAAIGVVFVPIYGLLNLFAYLSQLTIVPRLAALGPTFEPLLAQMIQAWPGSAVNVINNLGYAVLGMPSIIFGVLLRTGRRDSGGRISNGLRWGGTLLALSGGASIVGIVGIAAQIPVLELGSIVGGVLFLAALVPLSAAWLR